jgi:hypothetical protein
MRYAVALRSARYLLCRKIVTEPRLPGTVAPAARVVRLWQPAWDNNKAQVLLPPLLRALLSNLLIKVCSLLPNV